MIINVTKTYLPPFEEYAAILKRAWDKSWITNNGELARELENRLKEYLGVSHLLFTSNGTVVLQMALKAFAITKEVITTPFSYVATTNAILWEGCTPVFVDISSKDFCIDAGKIEAAITKDTQAILATHVYGLPCNVEAIDIVARKYNLKVIYDGAHAFGTEYGGKHLLGYGDVATCSFHATKLLHTVEGGCIICKDPELFKKLFLFRSFGHIGDEYFSIGINGKNSEFHAAMGLANLPYLPSIIQKRKEIHSLYNDGLKKTNLKLLTFDKTRINYNYSHFPVVFATEEDLLKTVRLLAAEGIHPRRYFYPSLNTLPFLSKTNACPVSEDIAKRVVCLPLYPDLEEEQVKQIATIVTKALNG